MTDWKKDLDDLFSQRGQLEKAEVKKRGDDAAQARSFIAKVVIPAFAELKEHLEKHGREVSICDDKDSAEIKASYGGNFEMGFTVKTNGLRACPVTEHADPETADRSKSEGYFSTSPPDNTITAVNKEMVIKYFVEHYKVYLNKT
jgi:hypothetical protein